MWLGTAPATTGVTWTKNLPEEFKKRRGYDLVKWIPVLTGRVVKSLEASEKFLWDFRKTIGEMIAETGIRQNLLARRIGGRRGVGQKAELVFRVGKRCHGRDSLKLLLRRP